MSELKAPEVKAILGEIIRGARKAFENAEQLFNEAVLLKNVGALSRALFLHQISMEECAKIELLGTWVTSLLMGHEVDIIKLTTNLANHKVKNYTNAYMLRLSQEEKEARKRGDWKASLEIFEKIKSEFHIKSNSAKNASLYVDFKDEKFVAPRERITKSMVSKIAEQNEEFLRLMYPKVEMLSGWENRIDDLKKTLAWFEARAEDLKSKLDPKEAMSTLMREMLERAKSNYQR